jgi:hypothetical protein
MKNSLISLRKLIAFSLLFLCATYSFSQYNQTPYPQYGGHSSNYYPHEHDSAITVMPKLIRPNFIYYGFLSSLNQHISFEYDRQVSDELMLCGQVGIINSGFSQTPTTNTSGIPIGVTNTVGGGYFEGSVKLFFNPDYTRDGKHGYYVVEGLYFKPQFVVSVFNTTSTTYQSSYVYPGPTVTNQYSYTGAAIMVNIGGQWIIAHAIAIDLYAGAGISFSNSDASEPFTSNYFSYLTAGQNFPLAVAAGVNIGLPFGN